MSVPENFVRTSPRQILKMALRRLARRHRFVGILIFELIERKCDAIGEAHGFRHRFRQIAKQPRHLIRRFEISFGIGFQLLADRMNRRFLANAGEHILQRTPCGVMIQHLVGRQQRYAGRDGDAVKPGKAADIVAAIQQARREPDAVRAAAL